MATLVSNPSCFYYSIVSYETIESAIDMQYCYKFSFLQYEMRCSQYISSSVSYYFTPPFTYSYACGSALLQSYVPVLMYAYVLSGLCLPVARLCIAHNAWVMKWSSLVNDVLFVEGRVRGGRESVQRRAVFEALNVFEEDSDLEEEEEEKGRCQEDRWTEDVSKVGVEEEAETEAGVIRVRGRGVMSALLLHGTVLLTFGLACPMLGVMVAVTIVGDVCVMKLLVGRYLSRTYGLRIGRDSSEREAEGDESEDYGGGDSGGGYVDMSVHSVRGLEDDSRDAWTCVHACRGLCVSTVLLYWSGLYLDMIGEDWGVWVAMWVCVSFVSLVSVLLFIVKTLLLK